MRGEAKRTRFLSCLSRFCRVGLPPPIQAQYYKPCAGVVKLVNTRDLKSLGRKSLPVQVRPPAPSILNMAIQPGHLLSKTNKAISRILAMAGDTRVDHPAKLLLLE